MSNSFKKFFLIALLFSLTTISYAQKSHSQKKREKELIGKEEEREKEAAKAKKDGLKMHQDIQTRQTRKRMRKSKKKAKKVNHNKGGFSLWRLLE